MTDVERLVRDALARHEVEMPTPDPLEARIVHAALQNGFDRDQLAKAARSVETSSPH